VTPEEIENDPVVIAALGMKAKGLPITICSGKAPVGINGRPLGDWGGYVWGEDHTVKMPFLWAKLNVGVKMGPKSGLIDIECDSEEEEVAFIAMCSGCDMPTTPTFRSTRGKHRIYQWDDRFAVLNEGVVSFRHNGAKVGCRLGANGTAVHSILPPSMNSDGTPREWLVSLDDCEPAKLPDLVVERIIAAARRDPGNSGGTAPTAGHGSERSVNACVAAMRRVKVEDNNDGSLRLYTYACRCVEFGLTDEQATACIRAVEKSKPFPKSYDDSEISARIRDAEKEVVRGKLAIDDDAVANAYIDFIEDEEGDEKKITVPLSMQEVLRRIRAKTDNWPRRVDTCLFIHDQGQHGLAWLGSTSATFGWLQSRVGKVEWHTKLLGGVGREETFAELQRTSQPYVAIEEVPHEPLIAGHYYACSIPAPGDGNKLRELLERFCPETEIDRDLLKAALMTFIWGGPGGTRPAFLLTSDHGRGVGKTKNAEMLASVVGGTISFSTNDDIGEIRSRLLSPAGLSKRIPFLDNIKSLKFSWAELESLITAPMVSGKRMYVGEAQRPNVLTWVLTLNGVSLSSDIAQRVVIIKLKRPQHDGEWEEATFKFIADNRTAIIADLIACLRAPAPKLDQFTRWATWEKSVLARLPEPADAQQVIVDRQKEADAERDEAGIVEDFFRDQLARLGYDCDHQEIFIPSPTATRWLNWATNENHKTTSAGKVIGQLADEAKFQSIRRNRTNARGRGWIWFGSEVPTDFICLDDIEKRMARATEEKERAKTERDSAVLQAVIQAATQVT